MKKLFFAAALISLSFNTHAAQNYCDDLLSDINSIEEKRNLRQEFNSEGSDVIRAYFKQVEKAAKATAQKMDLKERIRETQESAIVAASKNEKFNGYEVSIIQLDEKERPPLGLYKLLGGDALLQGFTNGFNDSKMIILKRDQETIILSTGKKGRTLVAAEIIMVSGAKKQFPERLSFGVKLGKEIYKIRPELSSLKPEPLKTPLTEEQKARRAEFAKQILMALKEPDKLRSQLKSETDYDFEYENEIYITPEIGFGTVAAAIKADSFLNSSKSDIKNELKDWFAIDRQFLQLAGRIQLQQLIKGIVSLHRKQQDLRKDHRLASKFYYDDESSVNVGSKFKVPGGVMMARAKSSLLKIHGYADIRIVLDVPRDTDQSVRLHIWDERDKQWAEEYVIPLNSKTEEFGPVSASSTVLPIIYRSLIEAHEQMQIRQEEIENGE